MKEKVYPRIQSLQRHGEYAILETKLGLQDVLSGLQMEINCPHTPRLLLCYIVLYCRSYCEFPILAKEVNGKMTTLTVNRFKSILHVCDKQCDDQENFNRN